MGFVPESRFVKTLHLGIYPSQSRQGPFVTTLGHHLHAHANTQNWTSLFQYQFIQSLTHARVNKPLHSPVERTHARQNEVLCPHQSFGGPSHPTGYIQPLVDIRKGLDVAEAVINQGDHQNAPPRRAIFRKDTVFSINLNNWCWLW